MIILRVPFIIYSILINIITAISVRSSLKWGVRRLYISTLCISMPGIAAYSNESIKNLLQYERCVLAISTVLLLILLIAIIDKKVYTTITPIKGISPFHI